MANAQKTVLVTGAAGFIGASLVRALLRDHYRVVGLDNLSYGSRQNIADCLKSPNFTLYTGDVRNPDDIARAGAGVGQIVHLAAYKIPRYTDALDTLEINALGSREIIRFAAREGIRVIAASTADVYGKSATLPFTEDGDLTLGPPRVKRWAYAVSKLYEEHLYLAYHARYNVPVVLVRFFGGYGPGMNLSWWGGPVPVFVKAALRRQPLPLHGDGQQTRSFTYIDDYIEPLMAIIRDPALTDEVLNIGGTEEITLQELAARVWRAVNGDEPQFELIPYSTFGAYEDCRRRVPDISRAEKLIGYRAKVGLDEGLRRTVAWLRNELGAGLSGPGGGKLIFAVPVLNERANLERLLPQLAGAAAELDRKLQVVIADDGSSDGTAEYLAGQADRYAITVLRHETNRGPGAAFRTLFTHLAGLVAPDDIVVTLEGDTTSDLAILRHMAARLAADSDVVLASCYHHGGGVVQTNAFRLLMSHIANGLAKVMLGLRGLNTLSSFYRAYRGQALLQLAARYGPGLVEQPGFESMIELLAKCDACSLRISEVPMLLDGSRRTGKSKMRVMRTVAGYGRVFARRLAGTLTPPVAR